MATLNFILVALLISFCSQGQTPKQKVVVDNGKKFRYTDTSGVTQSYISYFGDTFDIPELTTFDNHPISQSDLKGKTIFYNFWFVSCRPCVAEIPTLNKIVNKYKSDSTLFIAFTFDNTDKVKDFLQKHEFNFQIVSLSQTDIDKMKKISFFPFTAIISKEGKLSFALFSRPMGDNSEDELFNLFDKQMQKVLSK